MVFRMLSDGSKTGMVKKKVIRRAVKKLVRNLEKKSGAPVPKATRNLIQDIAIRELSKKSVNELPQFLLSKVREYHESMKIFDEMSEEVDENCKLMIDKLVEKLGEIRKEPFLTYWQHMPVINYCTRVSEDLENEHFRSMKKDTQVFLVSYLYLVIYELAIELLFDIALEISKKSPDDQISLNLKKAHERKPYLRTALFEFLEKGGYLEHKGSEFFTQLSNFRDKIAHLLVYFDNERGKLFLDGEYVDSLIVLEMYTKLLGLFSYLISVFAREPDLLKGLKNIENLLQAHVNEKRARVF